MISQSEAGALAQLRAMLDSIDSALGLAAYGREGGKYAFAKGLHEGMARDLLGMAEAARVLPEHIKDLSPGIPWEKLAGVRRRMLYDGFRLNPERLWITAETELPVIRAEIKALVAGLEQADTEDTST